MAQNKPQDTPQDINRPVALSLIIGMLLSVLFLVVGEIILLVNPNVRIEAVLPVRKAITSLASMQAVSWLSLGIFVLILTPFARVLISILSFSKIRDWKYAGVSVIVFFLMILGLVLGRG